MLYKYNVYSNNFKIGYINFTIQGDSKSKIIVIENNIPLNISKTIAEFEEWNFNKYKITYNKNMVNTKYEFNNGILKHQNGSKIYTVSVVYFYEVIQFIMPKCLSKFKNSFSDKMIFTDQSIEPNLIRIYKNSTLDYQIISPIRCNISYLSNGIMRSFKDLSNNYIIKLVESDVVGII